MARPSKTLVVCLDNAGYELALERRKIYVAIADAAAQRKGHIRVIDESGEDYLFPKSCFAPAKFPEPVRRALRQAA
jgi:putative heme iron utilization protein